MSARLEREQGFWDDRVRPLEECLHEVEKGPDRNTARAIELLSPLGDVTVLDVGCGAGVLSAWLAMAGARVTGVDLSPGQVARAIELHESLGLQSDFFAASLSDLSASHPSFDRLAGRYVLHHLDPPAVAGDLASLLGPGGKAAFVETMGLNPLLRWARARLAGRHGIPRYGTLDERPLTREDLESLASAFGDLRLEVAEMQFLRILDRQVLHYRFGWASRLLGGIDDVMSRAGLGRLSFHQVVLLSKSALQPMEDVGNLGR